MPDGTTTTVQLADAAADDLQLLLEGAYAPLDRFLGEAERAAVSATGQLPDGQPWELPLAVSLPAGSLAVAPAVGDAVVLADAEAVPLATLLVTEVAVDDAAGIATLAGTPTPMAQRSAETFTRLRLTPGATRAQASGRVLAVPTRRPLHAHDLEAVAAAAVEQQAEVLVLALAAAGSARPDALVRALLAASHELRDRGIAVRLAVVPLPRHAELDAAREERLVVRLARTYGADAVLLPQDGLDRGSEGGAQSSTGSVDGLPVPVTRGPAGPLDAGRLAALLDAGAALPDGFTTPEVERELRRIRPPARRRGATLLFTGLSGSGKSTLARAVAAELAESGEREITLLDGDRVRTLLSAGLTFSKADRETNIRRIGYVAAEVTKHGGTAVCAPIAPYDATRQEVRAMVQPHGEFVLVHVSTPLEVCEARDRKGLYALARAGKIPSFTGISDPYEAPYDADLVIDTSKAPLEECTAEVLDFLARRGLIHRGEAADNVPAGTATAQDRDDTGVAS